MRRVRYALALAAASSLGLVAAVSAVTPSIGAKAPEIRLTTLDGKPFTLSEAVRGKNAVVVMFIATKCPYSNAYNDRMRDMAITPGAGFRAPPRGSWEVPVRRAREAWHTWRTSSQPAPRAASGR